MSLDATEYPGASVFDAHPELWATIPGGDGSHRVMLLVIRDGRVFATSTLEPGDKLCGLFDRHKSLDPTRNGEPCGGYLMWELIPEWQWYSLSGHRLVKPFPLTVSPSLACRTCGSHGFIDQGLWRDA